MKTIIIIGAGMGGLAAGIYAQYCGFKTTIFEAHSKPGGQCTGWKRAGYTFDACMHNFNGFGAHTRINAFWRELGALPCEMVRRNEFVSALFPDGVAFHNYFDLDQLEEHMKRLAPEDTAVIDDYIRGLRSFLSAGNSWFDISNFGSFWEKLSLAPFIVPRLKYFTQTLGTFAARFKNPHLRRAFALVRHSEPGIPLFAYYAEHTNFTNGDSGWPKGGGMTIAMNMAGRYEQLGGTIEYRKKVVKILTENRRARGVELEDGTRCEADFVISNADGRKTILEMLGGQFVNPKITRYCQPPSDDGPVHSAVCVCLGVKRDLSNLPSAMLLFLDQPETIAGETCSHLEVQVLGFDASLAPAGKGVIKVELSSKPSYFSRFFDDQAAYQAEKSRLAGQVIALLDRYLPGLRDEIEVVDVSTLRTWERYMGGTQGHNNYPRKYKEATDIRNVFDFIFGLNRIYTLPGLKNFYLTGQWVTSMGSLFSNALTGKAVIQKICAQCGVKFIVA